MKGASKRIIDVRVIVRSQNTSNGGCRHEEKSHKHWSLFTKLLSSVTAIFLLVRSNQEQLYEKWNNIPHYTQTEINGRGHCEPSLTS